MSAKTYDDIPVGEILPGLYSYINHYDYDDDPCVILFMFKEDKPMWRNVDLGKSVFQKHSNVHLGVSLAVDLELMSELLLPLEFVT